MILAALHHHFRPGGVRRVIELALPQLVAHAPKQIPRVVLAAGEAPDENWLRGIARTVSGAEVETFVHSSFGYSSEAPGSQGNSSAAIRRGLTHLLHLCGDAPLVWAHNLGLGRNVRLARELGRLCHAGNIPLILHHHDWWFDNRWPQYAGIREAGGRTLAGLARAVLPASPWIAHAAINESDARLLQRHFGPRAGWLPNPVAPWPPVSREREQAARDWLCKELRDDAPVWLLPCRLLRRKNIAEALLLTRWLRPEAWLVTTAGVSSPPEAPYAAALKHAARTQGWRLRLAVLEREERQQPTVPELLAASEAVLLTSVQEGFGLPYLEASAAHRPLLARQLPNVAPDLAKFGFSFPQSYAEILIAPELFDWPAERRRQERLFKAWRSQMPRAVQREVPRPALLAAGSAPKPIPFSRLTLTAQLEVLAQPAAESWAKCRPLNLFLVAWREWAAAGKLRLTPWPRTAARWLGGRAYARRFFELAPLAPYAVPKLVDSTRVQRELLAAKLTGDNLFPLLWHPDT